MSHYFVSYARKDSAVVNPFVAKLKDRGFDIWQDVSGTATGIPFSTKWFDVITEAIYYSSGAFILYSENWENSDNCKDERELMEKTNTPWFRIDIESIKEDPEKVLGQAEMFIRETSTPRFDIRCRVLSSSYALKNGVDPYQLIERPNRIKRAFEYFFETVSVYFSRSELERYDPEFYPYIKRYTSFAFRTAIRSLLGVVLGIIMAAVLLITARPVNNAMHQGKINQRNAVDDKKTRAIIKSSMYRDPISAISRFSEMNLFAFASPSAPSLLGNAFRLAGTDMPSTVMFGSGETLTETETTGASERFTVTASEDAGMVIVSDSADGTEKSFTTLSPVTSWAWNSDGSILAYSCGRDVYVYDPLSKDTPPVRLSLSVYPITDIGFFEIDGEEKILARMENHVVVWNIPFALRQFRRGEVVSGCVTGEEDCAVYIADGSLILNRGNRETVIPAEVPAGAELMLVASGEGSQAALIYALGSEYCALILDTQTGHTITEAKLPCAVSQAVFSAGGDSLWLAGDERPVIMVDTSSGKVTCSSEEKKGLFVVPYADRVCSVGEDMTFTLYDRKCRPQRGSVLTDGYCMEGAEGAALPDVNRIYTTALWPGEKVEVRRVDLKEKTEEYVMFDCEQNDSECTAVAVTKDGRFLVYGFEDGTVRVHTAEEPYPFFEDRPIAEPVMDLRFCTDDVDRLSILGASGTVYMIDIGVSPFNTEYLIAGENRMIITDRLIEKAKAYYRGILDEDGVQIHP